MMHRSHIRGISASRLSVVHYCLAMKNPYLNALQTIAALGMIVGGLIMIVALIQAESANPSAAIWLGLGGSVFSLAVLSLFTWLHAAAVTFASTEPEIEMEGVWVGPADS